MYPQVILGAVAARPIPPGYHEGYSSHASTPWLLQAPQDSLGYWHRGYCQYPQAYLGAVAARPVPPVGCSSRASTPRLSFGLKQPGQYPLWAVAARPVPLVGCSSQASTPRPNWGLKQPCQYPLLAVAARPVPQSQPGA